MADDAPETGTPTPAERANALKARFDALPMRTRMLAFGGVALVVAAVVFFVARSGEPPMEILFAGLGPDDEARITERLSRQGIAFDSPEPATIRVPADRVHEVRLSLAAEGLPSGGGIGFEVFDEPRFGESEFSEQVQYHRALEGELSRTISHLAGVERARVHLVLPQRSLFVNREGGASASVVLQLRPGWQARDEQVRGIVHLVASSVRGLAPEGVTVVDGEGRDLTQGGGEEDVGDALAFRQRIEQDKAEAVQALLDTTFGPGVARVTVAADVSFRREERTEERYLPDEVAARSFQITEERDANANGGAEGVPGAASNLPGGDAPTEGADQANLRRRSETRNFEISKTVRHAVEPVGRVEKLQVAVVVDGVWEGETFTPRTDEELEEIRSIAEHAVGIDAERGDRVSVSCVPFHHPPEVELDALTRYEPYLPYASTALAIVVGLIVLLVLLRRRKKKAAEEAEAEKEAELARLAESGEGEDGETQSISVREVTSGEDAVDNLRNLLSSGGLSDDALHVQELASELAEQDVERAARVLRAWIREDAEAAKLEAESGNKGEAA